jgi:hypothetical protein
MSNNNKEEKRLIICIEIISMLEEMKKCKSERFPVLINQILQILISNNLDDSSKEGREIIQFFVCPILETIIIEAGSTISNDKNDEKIMELLLKFLQSESKDIHMDALFCVDLIVVNLKENCEKYLARLYPFLLADLINVKKSYNYHVAMAIFSEITRIQSKKLILPYCKEIINVLITNVKGTLDRKIFLETIVCLGEIALAIKEEFLPYFKEVMNILKCACETKIDKSNPKSFRFLNVLRESILETYTEIVQGLKHEDISHFKPYFPQIFRFIVCSYSGKYKEDSLVKEYSVGLIGDLGQVFGAEIKIFLKSKTINNIIDDAMKNFDKKSKETLLWTKKILDAI